MAGRLSKVINLLGNMGWRYVSFRSRYELMRRAGLLKRKFPVDPPRQQYYTLEEWKKQPAKFFFADRESLAIARNPVPELKETIDNIKSGIFLLFNSVQLDLGKNYDWVTNPDSGHKYDTTKHWTEIADYSKEAGDIKFVWEKSRFSYLYDVIRYDYHYQEDQAEFVFNETRSWIKSNPINCGPNYRCSQEMSLRVLNWTFTLFYYRNSPALTEEIFSEMQYIIYWHMHHVYNNINFSRIAVRNNHAITETLALYLVGSFFPAMPGADIWKAKGKAWFEEEIAYQVYEDGTYLQFSMNYHRVVTQLLTWGIALSEKNGDLFSDVVYERARKSVMFLRTCMVEENGWLPNYGANDGALFFKLSNNHFRDYRSQLQALASVLGMDLGLGNFEDAAWYDTIKPMVKWKPADGAHTFASGGYYIVREPHTLTFIKCGSYKNRPSQADNLHLDIWYKGENLLLDAGSYKYNTDEKTMRYFNGTASHNTVMLDDKDQMLKGGHFIWFFWAQNARATIKDEDEAYTFIGSVNVFRYINEHIVHRRVVIKKKKIPGWQVKDEMILAPLGMTMTQLWHLPLSPLHKVSFVAKTEKGEVVEPQKRDGWYSPRYGFKEKTEECYFTAENKIIDTYITVETD
jgi:hypothetical protein